MKIVQRSDKRKHKRPRKPSSATLGTNATDLTLPLKPLNATISMNSNFPRLGAVHIHDRRDNKKRHCHFDALDKERDYFDRIVILKSRSAKCVRY